MLREKHIAISTDGGHTWLDLKGIVLSEKASLIRSYTVIAFIYHSQNEKNYKDGKEISGFHRLEIVGGGRCM